MKRFVTTSFVALGAAGLIAGAGAAPASAATLTTSGKVTADQNVDVSIKNGRSISGLCQASVFQVSTLGTLQTAVDKWNAGDRQGYADAVGKLSSGDARGYAYNAQVAPGATADLHAVTSPKADEYAVLAACMYGGTDPDGASSNVQADMSAFKVTKAGGGGTGGSGGSSPWGSLEDLFRF